MKKFYMPSKEVLEAMYKQLGDGIYPYIVAKVVESLAVDGVNHPGKSILAGKVLYLRENPEIAYPICMMFPEELQYSEIAKDDGSLCHQIISSVKDPVIDSLDNLAYFTEDAQMTLPNINYAITTLAKHLPRYPKYRFTYVNSALLDNIFAGRIKIANRIVAPEIYELEPAYAVLNNRKELLPEAVTGYAHRYGISPEQKPMNSQPAKRLIRQLEHSSPKNLY